MFEGTKKDGTRMTVRAALRPLYDGDRIVGVIGTAEDITERKWNDALLDAQRELLELIAVGARFTDVLTRIAMKVESQAAGRCSILLVAPDGKHLQPGVAPSMPPDFVAATDGLPIGPEVGTCGTAAYLAAPVVSEDIASDPKWEGARELMAQHGIVSAWSTPIITSAGTVAGTFAIYYAERHTPTPARRADDRRLLAHRGHRHRAARRRRGDAAGARRSWAR